MKRFCIAGAGAIGGTLAARLAAAGHRVNVLARGDTLTALREHGLQLVDLSGKVKVDVHASDQADFGVQDVVFLCAKTHALPAMIAQVAPLIGPETVVVPSVNGVPWWYFQREGSRFDGSPVRAVDPDGVLLAQVPAVSLLGAVVYITAQLDAPGRVRASNPHRLVLGELDHAPSERLNALCALLSDAGIETRASTRIRDDIWTKITANLTSNPLSVLTGATLEEIYDDKSLLEIVVGILREVTLVATSYRARPDVDPQTFLSRCRAMGPFKTSMLQDFEKGRSLELAAIGDAVVELAERHNIPMPSTRAILALARYRASSRLGPADYPIPT
jgi:2-dehydropantoate 2-reductase